LRHGAKDQAWKHVAINPASLQIADDIQRAREIVFTYLIVQSVGRRVPHTSETELVLADSGLLVSDWLRTAKSDRGLPMYQEVLAIEESDTYKKKEKEGVEALEAWEVEQLQPITRRFFRDQGMTERVASGQKPAADDVYLSCVVSAPPTARGLLVEITFSESNRSLTFQGYRATALAFTPAFVTADTDNHSNIRISRSTGRLSWFGKGATGPLFSGECEVVTKTKF
jgi:hypothetical protein